MDTTAPRAHLREAGVGLWRAIVLGVATLLVLVMYVGMAYLVYREQMSDGPLVLFTGVILGYLLRSVRSYL